MWCSVTCGNSIFVHFSSEWATSKLWSVSVYEHSWNVTSWEECDIGTKCFPVNKAWAEWSSFWVSHGRAPFFFVRNLITIDYTTSKQRSLYMHSWNATNAVECVIGKKNVIEQRQKMWMSRSIWCRGLTWEEHRWPVGMSVLSRPCGVFLQEPDRPQIIFTSMFWHILQHDTEGWWEERRAGMERMVWQADMAKCNDSQIHETCCRLSLSRSVSVSVLRWILYQRGSLVCNQYLWATGLPPHGNKGYHCMTREMFSFQGKGDLEGQRWYLCKN